MGKVNYLLLDMSVLPEVYVKVIEAKGYLQSGEAANILAVNQSKQNKKEFLRGYDYMLSKIEPEAVICFGTPFDEMRGNIIPVDYRSSRKVVR